MIIPPPPKTDNRIILFVFITTIVIVLACVAVGIWFVIEVGREPARPGELTPSVTAGRSTPSLPSTNQRRTTAETPTITPRTNPTIAPGAMTTLNTLINALIPGNNPADVAGRLRGVKNIPMTLQSPPAEYQVGDEKQFTVVNDETDAPFKLTAILIAKTPHLYLWADKRATYNPSDAQKLADTFETKIYPINRAFFGSEWSPGIDNDPHLYVLLAKDIGARVAGYFSSSDSVHPLAEPNSNGHEMFVMNVASFPSLKESFIYSVLAHEFQHMIHWYRDRNEESWVNEGFSELAAFINGYGVGGHDLSFLSIPDLQLNDWPNDKTKTLPHYGASFLFVNYFLNRFGDDATKALVSEAENGLDSVDKVLAEQKILDKITSKPVTADDLFVDWTLANYLGDKGVGDGRFVYENYPQASKVRDTERITTCPGSNLNRTVSQYGTDYIRIACRGQYTLSFTGNQEASVVPANPHSGDYMFWSNKGDESDMTLTRVFDFSGVSGALTMSFWSWYDLEKNYDYLYLLASTDGSSWEMVKTPRGTTQNVAGNNLGIGYNDTSRGWVEEKVDLSKYAGKKVQLRFEYLTDAAVNGEGFLLDDISIPQVSYTSDFEKDDGGWSAEGFVRIQNRLPQAFRLSLIKLTNPKQVVYLEVSPSQQASITLNLDTDVVLVVSGITRYTRSQAYYTINIK